MLRATLPAGTVSGAPKVRAMEIIDELEPVKRGPYAGVVGYIDFSGNIDTAIAIRTMVVRPDGRASVQAGAGVVADSVPEHEDLECHNKAKALLAAVPGARRMTAQRRAARRLNDRHDLSISARRPQHRGRLRAVTASRSRALTRPRTSRASSARTSLALAVGASSWTFLLDPTGKLGTWLRVTTVGEQSFELDGDPGTAETAMARLNRFKLRTKADIARLDDSARDGRRRRRRPTRGRAHRGRRAPPAPSSWRTSSRPSSGSG